MKILRIIGREGRITIPYTIRKAAGFRPDDVVSFQLTEDGGVLVRKESFPNLEKNLPASDSSVRAFLDTLTESQRYQALAYLSMLWAENQNTGRKEE